MTEGAEMDRLEMAARAFVKQMCLLGQGTARDGYGNVVVEPHCWEGACSCWQPRLDATEEFRRAVLEQVAAWLEEGTRAGNPVAEAFRRDFKLDPSSGQ